jgi:predicted oxidoreductase
MKYQPIAQTNLEPSNVIMGMMRINTMSDDEIVAMSRTGFDAGVTMVDHADVYGAELHDCESRFANALNLTAEQRAKIVIQTKCGINPEEGTFDFSTARIVRQAENSLKALKTDYIDILLLHRPDALVEPDEVAAAFDQLEQAGKVRYFGVSNHTPRQIDLLKQAVKQPLVVNQVQLSITHAPIIASGVATNMSGLDQSIDRDGGGLVDYCRLNQITPQAWSPFQHGFFDGTFLGDRERCPELNDVIDQLAEKYQVAPISIATAWILRHPARFQVVLGTTNPQRITDAAAGSDITLTRAEWYSLFKAAGHILP